MKPLSNLPMKKIKSKSFSRLSKAAKRVAIAKDVIQQIKAGQFAIETGVWAEVNNNNAISSDVNQNMLLGRREPLKCNCCAVGAAFLSSMRLFNVAEFNEQVSEEYAFDQLERYFTYNQLRLIEQAFEIDEGACHPDGPESDRAIELGRKYSDETERALAIFQNIVRNKGTFTP